MDMICNTLYEYRCSNTTTKLLHSELNATSKAKVINVDYRKLWTLAYSLGIVKWSRTDLRVILQIITIELTIQIGHESRKCHNFAETARYLISTWPYSIASDYLRRQNRFAIYIRSRDSDGLRDGRPGFDSRQGQGIFSVPQRPDRLWGPLCLLPNGYRGLFLLG
jgi:hypothetical protein